jgi:hypothetical protein
MTIAFDYFNNSPMLTSFFKGVARRGLCQRLEERELRSLEEHPPLADLRQVPFSLQPQASTMRAILEVTSARE